jgi:hypothetical protein
MKKYGTTVNTTVAIKGRFKKQSKKLQIKAHHHLFSVIKTPSIKSLSFQNHIHITIINEKRG